MVIYRRSRSGLDRREFIRRLTALAGASCIGQTEKAAARHPPAVEPLETVGESLPLSPLSPPRRPSRWIAGEPTVLWDGESGVDGNWFNYGAGLPWENAGGDWFDANGV